MSSQSSSQMAYQFPDNPSVGQIHQGYVWKGSYWSRVSAAASQEPEAPVAAPCAIPEEPAAPEAPTAPLLPNAGVSTPCSSEELLRGNHNTVINLSIPIDLGQLLHRADHTHSDFDYIAPE